MSTHRPVAASGLTDADLAEINRLWTVTRAVTNTAHDVNNALQVIAGSVELLADRDLDPLVRRRLDAIGTESARAAAAIDQLLTYTRARPAPPRVVDLLAIARSVVDMRLASMGRSRIQLTLDPAATPCRAVADEARTAQAMLSLLLSAEHQVAGRRGARIDVGLASTNDAAVVTIAAEVDSLDTPPAVAGLDPAPSLTVEAGLWAAAHLAEEQQGRVAIDRTDRQLTLTLTLRPAP